MIFEVKDASDIGFVKEFLERTKVDHVKHNSPFECFLKNEIEECENVYEGSFGNHTKDRIAIEVEEALTDDEIDLVSTVYHEKVIEYAEILDMKPIGVATITNAISVLLKEIDDDVATVCYDKDVYHCEIIDNDEEGTYIMMGELKIYIADFMRVN